MSLLSPARRRPWAAVVALGIAWRARFGRTQYLGDWISYLNVSRAVSALDWRAIFNPMWNPGYPFLVALARGLAASTAEGEWRAITLLNVVILVGAYAAWRHLIRVAIAFYKPASTGMANHPLAVWTTTCLFLGCALGLQNASAVTPDLLVTTGFLLAAARTLSLIRRRTLWDAAALGVLLAAGVWVKGVFSAFALIFLFVILLDCLTRRGGWRVLLTAAGSTARFTRAMWRSISWSSGELTFGSTGPLNYAFHVDHLPHYTNWQGGPAPLGSPIIPRGGSFPISPPSNSARPSPPPIRPTTTWPTGTKGFDWSTACRSSSARCGCRRTFWRRSRKTIRSSSGSRSRCSSRSSCPRGAGRRWRRRRRAGRSSCRRRSASRPTPPSWWRSATSGRSFSCSDCCRSRRCWIPASPGAGSWPPRPR